jgi:hypothetical protein
MDDAVLLLSVEPVAAPQFDEKKIAQELKRYREKGPG